MMHVTWVSLTLQPVLPLWQQAASNVRYSHHCVWSQSNYVKPRGEISGINTVFLFVNNKHKLTKIITTMLPQIHLLTLYISALFNCN